MFPPKSLYLLLSGLSHFMLSKKQHCPNFLDTNQLEFTAFHNAMDNVFRKLRSVGVPAENKAFSKDETMDYCVLMIIRGFCELFFFNEWNKFLFV